MFVIPSTSYYRLGYVRVTCYMLHLPQTIGPEELSSLTKRDKLSTTWTNEKGKVVKDPSLPQEKTEMLTESGLYDSIISVWKVKPNWAGIRKIFKELRSSGN